MRFEIVSAPHPITNNKPTEKVPNFINKYFKEWSLLPVDNACICYYEWVGPGENITNLQKIIGCLRYNLCDNELYAEGTFVDDEWQMSGIGTMLWVETLNKEQPKAVHVVLASTEGKHLINNLKKIFKCVDFKTKEYDDI